MYQTISKTIPKFENRVPNDFKRRANLNFVPKFEYSVPNEEIHGSRGTILVPRRGETEGTGRENELLISFKDLQELSSERGV